MKDGIVRVAAACPPLRVADPMGNAAQAIGLAVRAAEEGAAFLTFPELCLTGATAADLLLQDTLLNGALSALRTYMEGTRSLPMVSVVGLPLCIRGRVYNTAAVVYAGKLLGIVPKTLLSAKERRHFALPAGEGVWELDGEAVPFGTDLRFTVPACPGLCMGVLVGDASLSPTAAAAAMALNGVNLLLSPAATPETVGAAERRRSHLTAESRRCRLAYVYAGAGEGESGTDHIYAGHLLVTEGGRIKNEAAPFSDLPLCCAEVDVQMLSLARMRDSSFEMQSNVCRSIEIPLPEAETQLRQPPCKTPFVPENITDREEKCALICSICSRALANRVRRAHAAGMVLGLSGGLDSTLSVLFAADAADRLGLPRTAVIAVTMPAFGTTRRTRGNAEKLAEALGITLRCIDIKRSVQLHFEDIGHDENVHDVVYENAQARERTQILMDVANGANALVVGTGDLSELALGYATYNGDHMSMYSTNASITKTMLRCVVRYYAEHAESKALADTLLDIVNTPVSPELLPPEGDTILQQTEQIVGSYELHDYFLYHMVGHGFAPKKIYRLACASFAGDYTPAQILATLKTFVRRFFTQQFKRSCLPDGASVGSLSLSPRGGWCMPSDAVADLWLSELEALDGTKA